MSDGIIKILEWFKEHPIEGLLIFGTLVTFRLFTIRVDIREKKR